MTPILDIICNKCGAKKGESCKTPSGKTTKIHDIRYRTYQKTMLYKENMERK